MARQTILLTKMQAAGNDFLVVDAMRRTLSSPAALARKLCHRRFGVGADGLILICPPRGARLRTGTPPDYRMRIFNSDGSEAEMCGNGSRCAVRFAVEHRIASRMHRFETLAGPVTGVYLSPTQACVGLMPPSDIRARVVVRLAGGRPVTGASINTGVPHFVAMVADVDKIDVDGVGRRIRFHAAFAPRGTNVNFVQVLRGSRIRVRTYERGVEAETLACGTGSTASAIVASFARSLRPPVFVETRGGGVLKISFAGTGSAGVRDVTMQGPVEKVFETRVEI